jgi:hypothetical protein
MKSEVIKNIIKSKDLRIVDFKRKIDGRIELYKIRIHFNDYYFAPPDICEILYNEIKEQFSNINTVEHCEKARIQNLMKITFIN